MSALFWRSVTPSNSPAFMVAGTELSVALAGRLSRFSISEHRVYDKDRMPDREYVVRDAYSVTDAEVQGGIRARIVARFSDLDEAVMFCDADAPYIRSEYQNPLLRRRR